LGKDDKKEVVKLAEEEEEKEVQVDFSKMSYPSLEPPASRSKFEEEMSRKLAKYL
jgi:hypothetical protein